MEGADKISVLDAVRNIRMAAAQVPNPIRYLPGILHFRNKFAAHYASTAKRGDDNAATIANCWSIPIVNKNSLFVVGHYSWNINGEAAEVKEWSLTMEWERLRARYPNWPPIAPFNPPAPVRDTAD